MDHGEDTTDIQTVKTE